MIEAPVSAIHGGKAKNDRIDAHKIAALLRGGMLPQAYVYPQGMRATRDLMRRRNYRSNAATATSRKISARCARAGNSLPLDAPGPHRC
jgi:transposase